MSFRRQLLDDILINILLMKIKTYFFSKNNLLIKICWTCLLPRKISFQITNTVNEYFSMQYFEALVVQVSEGTLSAHRNTKAYHITIIAYFSLHLLSSSTKSTKIIYSRFQYVKLFAYSFILFWSTLLLISIQQSWKNWEIFYLKIYKATSPSLRNVFPVGRVQYFI